MNKKNLLCIGASSPAANYFLGRSITDFNVYGLSSHSHKFIRTYRYSDVSSVSNLKFKKVIIFSSGVPSNCKSKYDYLRLNNSVKNILKFINLDQVDLTYISSYSVFSKGIDLVTEDTEYSPEDFYGESKVDMETYLLDAYSNNVRQLNILRLPVFLYKGVKNNFMGSALDKIRKDQNIVLFNPLARFQSVIDDRSLFDVDNNLDFGINLVNCFSNGDIKFEEIANLFKCYGAKNIQWAYNDRPSVQIVPSLNTRFIFEKISSKCVIENWLINENY